MSDFDKIAYYDLRLEAQKKRLPVCVGRQEEISRLSRVLERTLQHHCIVVAESGSGKTAAILGWAAQAAAHPSFKQFKIILLDASTLQKISQLPAASLHLYQEAFGSLENCILILDSFGEMIYGNPSGLQNWNLLIKPLLFSRFDPGNSFDAASGIKVAGRKQKPLFEPL